MMGKVLNDTSWGLVLPDMCAAKLPIDEFQDCQKRATELQACQYILLGRTFKKVI